VSNEDEPREYTLAEVRRQFLDTVKALARYWGDEKQVIGHSPLERCEGLAFSILVLLDGMSAGMPGFALVPSFHPGDPKHLKESGENWYPTQDVTCDIREDVMMHEEFYAEERARRKAERERTGGD
jgi:hypothetical protein